MIIPGEVLALMAALFWSIAVVIFKSLTQKISPFLVNALKNTIALACFIITLSLLKIPLLNLTFTSEEYIKFIISGLLGMGIADAIFIYSLSKIGANRIAILNCFEPIAVYCFTFFLLGTSLSILESIGFIIVIISILVISYEKDQDDIDPKVKKQGILLQICAILCSALSMVMIKDILNLHRSDINSIIWIAVFRLFIGFIASWTIFLCLKNKRTLLTAIKEKTIIIKIITSSVFGTFMALGCWMMGQAYIEKLPLASILGQTALIFIIIFSWIFLNEKITKVRIIASAFALLGVFLSNYF
tara:strand:- start:1000 stop:1905 length:906 start_codon:yes stop_codon:yes gene_type:complete